MNKLAAISPDTLDLAQLTEWVKNQAAASAAICAEAEAFYKKLKRHHANIAELMAESNRLRKEDPSNVEEMRNIAETIQEVVEAMSHLTEGTPLEFLSADDGEKEFLSSADGKEAQDQADRSKKKFLQAYIKHKDRLGLVTQQDVAHLTGLDRRYVSSIENGKYKPQFKTIKKIADAFGAKVEEFI